MTSQISSTSVPNPFDDLDWFGRHQSASGGTLAEATVSLAQAELHSARICILDDEPANIRLVSHFLTNYGFTNVATEVDPAAAVKTMFQEPPDLVLLDLDMPGMGGFDVLHFLREQPALAHMPVVILTANEEVGVKRRALEAGANDFLTKPVDRHELLPRVRNLLTLKKTQDAIRYQAAELERIVRQRTEDLRHSRLELVECLGRAGEFRDNETGRHVIRVGKYVGIIARELGMDEAQAELLEMAAYLHDIGKIGIPDAILLKPDKLDDHEFGLMRQHACFGNWILEHNSSDDSSLLSHTVVGMRILEGTSSPLMLLSGRIALTHHERWDGGGYPVGLTGDAIPLEGRITALADVFDALSSKRPYKPAFPLEKCLGIIEAERGKHFDPAVVDAFLRRLDQILQIREQYADVEPAEETAAARQRSEMACLARKRAKETSQCDADPDRKA